MKSWPFLLALIGCGGPDTDSTPATGSPTGSPTSSTTPGTADLVRTAAEAAGWTVQEGRFVFSTMEYCCDAGVTCLGNNPATPYGLVALPPGPGQTAPDVDTFWMWGPIGESGLSRTFRLRPDEAVLVVGEAPPPSKYFSLRSSIGTRLVEGTGQRALVLGSLGPTTNHLSMAAERGVDPSAVWAAPLGIVTSADAATEAAVDGWLVAAGLPASSVHHDRMSIADGEWGLEEGADSYMVAARVAVPDDPEAMAAYEADPPLRVLRLSPPEDWEPEPMGRQPLPARGSGLDESAWAAALDELQLAVEARFAGSTLVQAPVNQGFTETFDCIADYSCIGDVRDRYAARVESFWLPDDGSAVVVYGINHERTGRTAYSNFSVMVNDNWVGAASVNSDAMIGSARAWLGDAHPQVDDLYAWILARDCSPYTEPCLEVRTECPWPALDESLFITWRMYLDPVSGAAPLDEELVIDRLLHVQPATSP